MEANDVQVDPNVVIRKLREEMSGWILRALVAESATEALQAKEKQAANIEARRAELAEAPKPVAG